MNGSCDEHLEERGRREPGTRGDLVEIRAVRQHPDLVRAGRARARRGLEGGAVSNARSRTGSSSGVPATSTDRAAGTTSTTPGQARRPDRRGGAARGLVRRGLLAFEREEPREFAGLLHARACPRAPREKDRNAGEDEAEPGQRRARARDREKHDDRPREQEEDGRGQRVAPRAIGPLAPRGAFGGERERRGRGGTGRRTPRPRRSAGDRCTCPKARGRAPRRPAGRARPRARPPAFRRATAAGRWPSAASA